MPSSACYADVRVLHSFPTRRSSDLGIDLLCRGGFHFSYWQRRRLDSTAGDDRLRFRHRCYWRANRRERFIRRLLSDGHSRDGCRLRSEEHTSELQSLRHLVCRLLPATPMSASYTLSLHDALPILASTYFAAAVFIFLIGSAGASIPLLVMTVFASGIGVIGGQTVANALSADYYPTAIRATGVG